MCVLLFLVHTSRGSPFRELDNVVLIFHARCSNGTHQCVFTGLKNLELRKKNVQHDCVNSIETHIKLTVLSVSVRRYIIYIIFERARYLFFFFLDCAFRCNVDNKKSKKKNLFCRLFEEIIFFLQIHTRVRGVLCTPIQQCYKTHV